MEQELTYETMLHPPKYNLKERRKQMQRKLPSEIKMTWHAQQRLEERNKTYNYYDTKNLMKSSRRWYGKDDLIHDCALYRHCCYTCRKSNQLGYITDGTIEVIYNKNTHVAVTVLEVKDKFKPVEQYIKPEVLEYFEDRKVVRKMRKLERNLGECPDCGKTDVELMKSGVYEGLCDTCKRRKQNAKARGKVYVAYKDLDEAEKKRIDIFQLAQAKKNGVTREIEVEKTEVKVVENYYQAKAEQNPAIARVVEIERPSIPVASISPLTDPDSFINTLRSCGCEIPQDTLKDVLNVLVSTDKLKDVFMTIADSDSQDAILDLEQALNVVERKLQHDWEYNGFQEADDIKFKGFLTWRRVLKGAIFFWKKLYQTNALIEMQRAWNAYTADPNDKILLAGDRIDSALKRYQITTESISTIFNTRRPFTRVFYAKNEEDAHEMLVKWFADRQLHENKAKTVITELKADGSSVYEVK
jgi:ribosomal protein L37AE/L43A